MRYQVESDYRRFDRKFAVVDTTRQDRPWALQTNDENRARNFAAELNGERKA